MSVQKSDIGSYTAGEALAKYTAVRLSSGSGTSVVYADATHEAIGITTEAAANGAPVSVRHLNDAGTFKITMAGAASIGDTVYPAADGRWDDTLVDGVGCFELLEASTAAGDVVEALPVASINRKAQHLLYSNTAASSDHENTTTAADFDVSYTLDGSKLQVGDVIEIIGQVFVLDQNGSDTLTCLLKFGTETLLTTGAVAVSDNDIFGFHFWVQVRTTGATGTCKALGHYTALDQTATAVLHAYKAQFTEDISGNVEIAVNADHSAAHADNEAYLDSLIVIHHRR